MSRFFERLCFEQDGPQTDGGDLQTAVGQGLSLPWAAGASGRGRLHACVARCRGSCGRRDDLRQNFWHRVVYKLVSKVAALTNVPADVGVTISDETFGAGEGPVLIKSVRLSLS